MNEKQILELKQLVDQLTDQGLPTEEIQAQVDLRKQEFKQLNESAKTTPVETDATAGEEIASDMELTEDDGDLATTCWIPEHLNINFGIGSTVLVVGRTSQS